MEHAKEILEQPLHNPDGLEHEEFHEEDFSNFSKADLLKHLTKYKNDPHLQQHQSHLRQMKAAFDALIEEERHEALQKFLEEGNEEADFALRKDETTREFEKLYTQLKDSIHKNIEHQEKERHQNLVKKETILNRLRALVSEEENAGQLEEFRKLQDDWRKTGPVPAGKSQELWANYNALTDIFYNNRSIFFELMELDRKKNLEVKIEICERAEKLADVKSVSEAMKELRLLHEEYKETGPIPKEEQEKVWERFKQASDKIYEKRKNLSEEHKKLQEENYTKKTELIARIQPYQHFQSDRIDDWKVKTAEVLGIQKEWKAIGGVTTEKSKDVNKSFWSACKLYFKAKNDFFNKLDSKREENLQKKVALCEQAEALKDEQDLQRAINSVKSLQEIWNKAGQVPLKKKEEIWNRFRKACDEVFDRKRAMQAGRVQEQEENLKKKEELCAVMENANDNDLEKLREYQKEWKAIGHVPREQMQTIQERYNKALDALLDKANVDAGAKQNMKLSMEAAAIKAGPEGERNLRKKEQEFARKIQAIKGEITQYKTNIEFFGRSKNADALKKDILAKIEEAEKQLKELEAQLKIIKSA